MIIVYSKQFESFQLGLVLGPAAQESCSWTTALPVLLFLTNNSYVIVYFNVISWLEL